MRRWLFGPAPARAWDDLRLVGLKLIFLIVSRAVSLLGLSRREWWWKDAEILMPAVGALVAPGPLRAPGNASQGVVGGAAAGPGERVVGIPADPE